VLGITSNWLLCLALELIGDRKVQANSPESIASSVLQCVHRGSLPSRAGNNLDAIAVRFVDCEELVLPLCRAWENIDGSADDDLGIGSLWSGGKSTHKL
jgi:hypothetical protein